MMKKAVLILCLLVLTQTHAFHWRRGASSSASSKASSKSNSSGTNGRASASASAKSKGGKVVAKAVATSESTVIVRDALVSICAASIAHVEQHGYAVSIAQADARSYGLAIARAYTEAYAEVVSESKDGGGCASAFGEAKASATSFARVLVEVLAGSSNYITFSKASAAIDALVVVTANAYANANADVCVYGEGNAVAFQQSFSEAIASPYVEVFAAAYAAVAGGDSASALHVVADAGVLEVTSAETTSQSETEGDAHANAGGFAGADTSALTECGWRLRFCCNSRYSSRPYCPCGYGCRGRVKKSTGSVRVIKYDTYFDRNQECACTP